MKKLHILQILLSVVVVLFVCGFIANAQGGKFVKVWPDMVNVYKLMTSPKEFLSQGGDWNAIETLNEPQCQELGSVSVSNEYQSVTSTSTPSSPFVFRKGRGTLGSVVITIAGASGDSMTLYDATTTNATLRTNTATTVLASFNSNATVGTYTFDTIFNYGLLLEATSKMGSTTITYR
jgi:hypothetical protein